LEPTNTGVKLRKLDTGLVSHTLGPGAKVFIISTVKDAAHDTPDLTLCGADLII
jgi:hypothetical protein